MGNLSSLKLVAQRQPSKVSPVVHRRNKLMGKLKDQIALARAAAEGGSIANNRRHEALGGSVTWANAEVCSGVGDRASAH